jgi:hypothetical protein
MQNEQHHYVNMNLNKITEHKFVMKSLNDLQKIMYSYIKYTEHSDIEKIT